MVPHTSNLEETVGVTLRFSLTHITTKIRLRNHDHGLKFSEDVKVMYVTCSQK